MVALFFFMKGDKHVIWELGMDLPLACKDYAFILRGIYGE